MKKKITLLFAMLAVCLSGMADGLAVGAEFTCGTDGMFTCVVTDATNHYVSIHATMDYDEDDDEYYPITAVSGAITIPASVTNGGVDYTVKGLASFTGEENDKTYSPFYYCEAITSVTISAEITELPNKCFYGCSKLESISLPSTLTKFGTSAFDGCEVLRSIVIPSSVTQIGKKAFNKCLKLESIDIPASVTQIGNGCLDYCNALTCIKIGGSENAFTTNGKYEARGEDFLIEHDGTAQKLIGFAEEGLSSVTVPDGITSLEEYVFAGCTNLTSITISSSVISIGRNAFQECSGMTSITIPSSVTSIGIYGFYQCSRLTSVTFEGTPTIGTNSFNNCTKLSTVIVPADASDTFTSSLTSTGKAPAGISIIRYDYLLKEGVDYTVAAAESDKYVIYSRTFTNQNWQALFLPFEVAAAEWSENFEAATLTSYNSGTNELTWTTLEETANLAAGTPYIIKPKSESGATLLISAVKTLVANTTINNVVVGPEGDQVTLSGTYAEKTMSDGNFWGLSDGNFYYTNNPDKKLKPYRIFLIAPKPAVASAPIRNRIVGEDSEANSIGEIEGMEINPNAPAYNLQGVRVGSDYKGIVIVNGKKTIRK